MAEIDPFLTEGPALVSFSGGRTSGYMLWRILQAHGGTLPADVIVAFANTGRERPETLRFVHECGTRWNVPIVWLERPAGGGFDVVGFNSASRNGEPFSALIADRQFMPNAVARFCTQELKVRVLRDYCQSIGWKRWFNVVGLRYDEGLRVMKMLARNEEKKERWISTMPLSKAKITKRDVLRFWLGDNADPLRLTAPVPQGFDLGLRDYEGNCDLCFLKSKAKLLALIRENPGMADWWTAQEIATKGRFVTEYSYAQLAELASAQGHMFDVLDDEDFDVECGLTCAGDVDI